MSSFSTLQRVSGAGLLRVSWTRPKAVRQGQFRRAPRKLIGPVCFREKEGAKEQVQSQLEQTAGKVSGFLSAPGTQSTAYTTLAALAAGTAAFALLAPSQFAGLVFKQPIDAVAETIVRSAGATLLLSASTKYTLREAARRSLTHVDMYQRLNVGLMLQSLLSLVVLAQGFSVRTELLLGFVGTICGVGLAVTSRIFALSNNGSPLPSLTSTFSSMLSVLRPKSHVSAVYSLLTVTFALKAIMLFKSVPAAHLFLFDAPASVHAVFMNRITAAGVALAVVVCFCLKEAADASLLGRNTFKLLNVGLAADSLAMLASFGAAMSSGLVAVNATSLGMLGVQATVAVFALYHATQAKVDKEPTTPAPAT